MTDVAAAPAFAFFSLGLVVPVSRALMRSISEDLKYFETRNQAAMKTAQMTMMKPNV